MTTTGVHESNLTRAAILSSYWKADMITPLDVITVLNKAKISFVLVGAYGLAGWLKEPRATQDVDIVVAARQIKKAIQVLVAAFPRLESVDLPVVVRLMDSETQKEEIDILKPVQQPYREVFHHTHSVSTSGQRYRVPSLEMAIVMKFTAMTSLYRAEADKYQDAHDFIHLVQKNPELDSQLLTELGSLIYPDGGKDVLELVRRAQVGEKLLI